jgi:hypothetical protein
MQYGKSHNISGIGFVLGYRSGIVGIDLDDVLHSDGRVAHQKYLQLADTFNSYTELSPSGTGLHVLIGAQYEGGRRMDGLEVYGQGRFFTVTGKSYGHPRPLANRQAEVLQLVADIDTLRGKSGKGTLNWDAPQKYEDEEVYRMAQTAANGQKFFDLWNGQWQSYYGSQSEADVALVNIIGFYTDNVHQIQRMFLLSGLGQRDKAKRNDYVLQLIAKSQDKKVPLVAVPPPPPMPAVPATVEEPPEPDTEDDVASVDEVFTPPEGAVAEIAKWFHAQSVYPIAELSIMGALGLIAGICGRQYQYAKGGVNLYMMLLAETGAGKDALSTGMSRIFDAVAHPPPDYVQTPTGIDTGFKPILHFQGPSRLTGKGILRKFQDSDTLSMVSVLPEFSQTMTQMADPRANDGLREFQHVLLEFYTKSAFGSTYGGSMNADKAKDVEMLPSPALTMLCEGTPARFYGALTETMVSDGLMSRFIIIDAPGYRDHNPNHEQFATVPADLKQYVTELAKHVITLRTNGDLRINVQQTPEAADYSAVLRSRYRAKGINGPSEVHKYLWMRAHQNLSRIAAIVAIGVNYFQPTVTVEHLQWADRIIHRQCELIVGKFKRGETGQVAVDDKGQFDNLRKVIAKWVESTPKAMERWPKFYHEAWSVGLVPYSFIQQRAGQLSEFRTDRRGSKAALRAAIDDAISVGLLERVNMQGSAGQFYRVHL